MRSRKTFWRIREHFKENECDNLFYDFTADHRMDFLWNDDDLNTVMDEHFGEERYERFYIQSLMKKGYFHVLRCMRREKASLCEKRGLMKNIEKAINEDRNSKHELLAYLHSFCDAIDYYSIGEKAEMQKHSRIRSLICFLSVACVTLILGFTIHALMKPEAVFPISHLYAYEYLGERKLIDVAYQYNKVKGITFYDKQGNVKTELSDWNEWGTYNVTVHEAATESEGEKDVYYRHGSSVPIMITEHKEDGNSLTVHYKENGKISYTEENNPVESANGSRYVYYSDDGTDISVRVWDGQKTWYCASSALEPLYTFTQTHVEGEDWENYKIIYQDVNGDTVYTNDVECIRKADSSLRIIKDTLENGAVQNYYAVFYNRGSREYDHIVFPSESLFLAHPESNKEYKNGRLIRESWGPMPEYKLAWYEYIYEQDILTGIREYVIPYAYEASVDNYETIPVYRYEYRVNTQGHITEIISHDHCNDSYYYSIEYGDNSKIMKINVYYDYPSYISEEPKFLYSYRCNYGNNETLESILVEGKEENARMILVLDSDEQIVDYSVLEAHQP